MHLRRLDLNLLVIFDAVVRTGSVTRASQVLSLSQPAVSHALNRLRAAVGDPLFVRSHGRLVPTPRAERMRAPVASLLQSARAVLVDETFTVKTATSIFRVGVSDYAALICIPHFGMAMRNAAPLVRLEMEMVNAHTLERLESGLTDCTFWGAAAPSAPFESTRLFQDRFVGVVCRHHTLAKSLKSGKRITVRNYLAYPHAMVALPGTQLSPVDLALAKLGQNRRIGLVTPGFASILSLLKGSDLVASIPEKLADLQKRKEFATFELPIAVPSIAYSLVWHRRKTMDPGNAWLRKLIQQSLAR